MGFNSVYRCLLDVFPQVDSRLLRAFAIEHSKDPDVAVEIVLSEVLPYLSKHSIVSEDLRIGSSVNAEDEGQINEVTHQLTKKIASQCTRFPRLRTHQQTSLEKSISAGETSTANEHTSKIDPATEISHSDSNSQSKEQNPPTVLSRDSNIDNNLVQGNEESEEVILLLKHQCQEENVNSSSSQISKTICKASAHENNAASGQISTNIETVEPASMGEAQDMNTRGQSEEISQVMSASLMRKNDDSNGSFIGDVICVGFDGPGKDECGKKSPQVESVDATLLESENFVNQQKPVVGVTGLSMEVFNNSLSEYENVKSSKDIKIKQFEDIVEGAKNNKNTLFSATESVMNMMRQVKLQEKAAEQAKEEAAGGGLDILIKVLDLKRMLAHAKEANDMHAGEVYGEKTILATEMKELQGHLQILSNERDKSLGILLEMHQTLEARQIAAEELRKAAEQEKLDKEESAKIALAEQEALMEKVVQESKILQQEAEENNKLRDFLMEQGRVVDELQGEISVICQDVRLLKEKFDEWFPLSKSISSSQTSCILASSGSSLQSMTSNGVLVPQTGETSDSPKEISPLSSVEGQSPRSRLEVESNVADHKDAMDEEWEWFEAGT